jgi:hypothetical protein
MAKTPKTDKAELPEDLKTEQDKGPAQPNPEPVDPSVAEVVKVDQHEPYPTGSPPDPDEAFEKAHGFRRKEGE